MAKVPNPSAAQQIAAQFLADKRLAKLVRKLTPPKTS